MVTFQSVWAKCSAEVQLVGAHNLCSLRAGLLQLVIFLDCISSILLYSTLFLRHSRH